MEAIFTKIDGFPVSQIFIFSWGSFSKCIFAEGSRTGSH
jgi:hypothetical protein